MAKDVIMPALGMAQETGTLLQWLKAPGDAVSKGDPLMEIETDKTTAEVEAPASGILAKVTAKPGDVIPVGQTIAVILAEGEVAANTAAQPASVSATPVAQRIAAEHQLDLAQVKPHGGRVQKEDVLAYVAAQKPAATSEKILASPKARRLASEKGIELTAIAGSGPDGVILAEDVLAIEPVSPHEMTDRELSPIVLETMPVSRIWRVMVDRLTQAWNTVPHFYLMREVNAGQLMQWLSDARIRSPERITYTDLLVKLVAASLRRHPRLNASWRNDTIISNPDVNIGLAAAIEDGLVVPVVHRADMLGLSQLAARRGELIARAQAGKLAPDDLSGGTFTISNLGMYGVDAFNAIVNPPQAAILAVSRIADRVVPVNGQPSVQPMMTLNLSCDHRVVDGARGAEFLQTLANLIESPMQLLD